MSKQVDETKNVPQSDTSTRQYIFNGASFVGPAVSKEEYIRHYEEYLKCVSISKADRSSNSGYGFH